MKSVRVASEAPSRPPLPIHNESGVNSLSGVPFRRELPERCLRKHDDRTTIIHTIGYQLRTARELIDHLHAAGVQVLIDVRQTPWSNRRDFSRFRLQPALEAESIIYVHAAFAGNPKELRRAASTHAECLSAYADYLTRHPSIVIRLAELISTHTCEGRSISLFCYERHPEDCHRGILARRLTECAEFPIELQHLGPDGAPRFLS